METPGHDGHDLFLEVGTYSLGNALHLSNEDLVHLEQCKSHGRVSLKELPEAIASFIIYLLSTYSNKVSHQEIARILTCELGIWKDGFDLTELTLGLKAEHEHILEAADSNAARDRASYIDIIYTAIALEAKPSLAEPQLNRTSKDRTHFLSSGFPGLNNLGLVRLPQLFFIRGVRDCLLKLFTALLRTDQQAH